MTHTMTFVRTEVVRTQVLWTDAVLNSSPVSTARELIRAAFARDAFNWVAYFAIGPDGLCYASLRVNLDFAEHREQLLTHPRVRVTPNWVERVAPDLRVLVEEFEGLVARHGFRVVARLGVRRGAMSGLMTSQPGDPIVWAVGPVQGLSQPIKSLPELTTQYALSDALTEPSV